MAAVAATPTSDAPENVETAARGAHDNPEQRPLGERCLLGFGSTSGPPSLPVLYNNFKQIVQTKDYVMILVEMNHDARVIPLNTPHAPAHIKKWMGDSVARYEGDRAGDRDDELHRQDQVPRSLGESESHRAILAPGRQDAHAAGSRSRIPRRGQRRGPASIPGSLPNPMTGCANTPATKATTRSAISSAANGSSKPKPLPHRRSSQLKGTKRTP